MEGKGMKVNMNKSKVVISGESCKEVQKFGRWPWGGCSRDVARNSIHYTN